jgi:hypothetical protein
MAKREPQQHENPKTTLFVSGQKTSQILKLAVADLCTIKRPFIERFTKKNDIHPFDDASSLEFFSQKNDTSLIVLSLHSKKRPHCLTLARTFSYKMLDMLELYLNAETFRTLQQFKNKKPSIGLKPLISFHGTVFEDPNQTKYTVQGPGCDRSRRRRTPVPHLRLRRRTHGRAPQPTNKTPLLPPPHQALRPEATTHRSRGDGPAHGLYARSRDVPRPRYDEAGAEEAQRC